MLLLLFAREVPPFRMLARRVNGRGHRRGGLQGPGRRHWDAEYVDQLVGWFWLGHDGCRRRGSRSLSAPDVKLQARHFGEQLDRGWLQVTRGGEKRRYFPAAT